MSRTVAVMFGGRAPEHEVSIITGIQVMHALLAAGYEVLPLYITKEGKWVLGDSSYFDPKTFRDQGRAVEKKVGVTLPANPEAVMHEVPGKFSLVKTLREYEVDVFFPCFHGRYGEDGSVQGLLEMAGVAYTGCGVEASAIGMDKVVSKRVAESVGIPVLRDNWANKGEWEDWGRLSEQVMKGLNYPVFVKPARLGSSIGIKKVKDEKQLKEAMEVAFCYDEKVMVEQGVERAMEVNISLIGNNPYQCSATERPLGGEEMLSFEDKYIAKKGRVSKGMATAKREVPAKIKRMTEEKIREYARRFFAEIDGSGICRIDFLVSRNEREIYFNEINTLPGSIAFYLWKAKGMPIDKLVARLVELAEERKERRGEVVCTFASNILAGFEGVKGKIKL